MLDKKLKPWLLEVNESPSFNDDTEVDKMVKGGLISDTFKLLNLKAGQKRKILDANNKGVLMRNKMNNMTSQQIKDEQEVEHQSMMEQQRKHESFCDKNLGGFTKIWPIPCDDPALLLEK